MKKAKFWLAQIAMVAIVSLAFGSPVFADDENFDDTKWHENLDAWLDKKVTGQPEKSAHWQEVFDSKLAEHNAEFHPDDPNPDPTCEDFDLMGTWPNCF